MIAQIWQIIQRSGCLRMMDAALHNVGYDKDIQRIRLLRRHPSTMAAFGAAVGIAHAYNMAARPVARTTRHCLHRLNADCACQMQALSSLLYRVQPTLLNCVPGGDLFKEYYFCGYLQAM